MKSYFFPASLLVLSATLFFAGAWYGRQPASQSASPSQRKALYYVDPMNPSHTSAEPGLAPCGMKMEPVYAEADPGTGCAAAPEVTANGAIRVSSERQQLIGIQLTRVEQAPISHTIRLLGRVAPDDRRIYRINAGVDGIIREISGLTTGSQVKKDQWLATFSAPNARATMQGLVTAVDVLERQKKSDPDAAGPLTVLGENVRLAADRLEGLGLSPLQIEEIRSTREVPTALRIHAPADGFILGQDVTPGLKFEKGAEWYRIADLARVWVLADVYSQDAEYFRPGVEARVSVAGSHRALTARVSETLPQFDPAARTLKVRFEVDNPEIVLRPEMLVDVTLSVELPPLVAVPVDAVLDSGLNATVFIARDHGLFEPRAVETGRRLGARLEVLKGLDVGEQIVTGGNFFLDSESRMKLAASGPRDSGEEKDPICGMTVDEKEARTAGLFTTHQGRTYYFCNPACKQKFEREPDTIIQKLTLARGPHAAEQHASVSSRN